MSGHLTSDNRSFVRKLKNRGILRNFTAEDLNGVVENGGVWVRCSDGDIDDSSYCKKTIAERNHELKYPGGSLNLCLEYKGYKKGIEEVIIEGVANLFEAKSTQTLFLGNHFPCGMASKYGHGIEEVVKMTYLVNVRFRTDLKENLNSLLPVELFLEDDRIFNVFHVKRFNVGGAEEQNTYIFDPDGYAEYFI